MNSFINIDSKLADIIINEPSVVTVLNRFGITLGVADKTIGSVCAEKNLDREFFATIINTYINEDYFPERILSSFSASKMIDYLRKTNSHYEQFQIPNIERHFHFLISKSDPANSNLGLMLSFFNEVKSELLSRIANDNKHWFPRVISMEQHTPWAIDSEIDGFDEEDDNIEDKINDLVNMLVIHLKGGVDNNLAYAVLTSLVGLKKDIRQNNRIRNRILRPLEQALAAQSDKT